MFENLKLVTIYHVRVKRREPKFLHYVFCVMTSQDIFSEAAKSLETFFTKASGKLWWARDGALTAFRWVMLFEIALSPRNAVGAGTQVSQQACWRFAREFRASEYCCWWG